MGWELAAILAAGLFAGASVYINFVEHPARVQCGTELAVTAFGPSYHRATVMQVPLAIIGLLAGLGAWINGSGVWWLIGGVLLGSVIPFTLLVIFPTNRQLLDPTLDRRSQHASNLLAKWARLHSVRSVLGCGAFVLFVCLVELRMEAASAGGTAHEGLRDASVARGEIGRGHNLAHCPHDHVRRAHVARHPHQGHGWARSQ